MSRAAGGATNGPALRWATGHENGPPPKTTLLVPRPLGYTVGKLNCQASKDYMGARRTLLGASGDFRNTMSTSSAPRAPPLDRVSRPGGRLGTPWEEARRRGSTLSVPRAPPLDRVSRPGGHLGSPWKKARCRGRRDGPRMARPFAGRRATKIARRPKPRSSLLVPWARLLESKNVEPGRDIWEPVERFWGHVGTSGTQCQP